ncbi:MAG: type IV secretion system DotC family protein [Gammaproteobacteria bacterium]|nr:type IV secretion system DotC family protein [Gammaproteobacteria bacterium]
MQWRKLIQVGVIVPLAAIALSGCGPLDNSHSYGAADTEHLNAMIGYVNVKKLPAGSTSINQIRYKALEETATQLGATGALAWRSKNINSALELQANYLDRVFDFNQLMLPNSVLPPVLVEANDELNQDSSDTLRLASKIYKIEAPARFVTAPPNWRNYLWMNFKKPALPSHTLLPNSRAEANTWNYFLKQGWQQGLQQADQIFEVNLNRLKRDYAGMILYRKLYSEHIVSAPFVAKADLGVTGNKDELRINDRVLRITAGSALQTNSKKWLPVLTK